MIKLPVTFHLEQAVYGSFPFWNQGYALLAHSAGCRSEWLTELRTACQRCGEPPAGLIPADSLFALRLRSGPWMIVGVHPQGCDDLGRPGAMAFHALFVNPWAYRWAGADPFVFAGALRRDWTAADQKRCLPAVTWNARISWPAATLIKDDDDLRLVQIVGALTQRRRVVVQSNEPIDRLARSAWRALPRFVRRRATFATWAFDNANEFDLVGSPKLAGFNSNPSDLIFAVEGAGR